MLLKVGWGRAGAIFTVAEYRNELRWLYLNAVVYVESMQWTLTQTSSFTQTTAGALFLRCSSGQQKLQPLLDRFALTPRRPGRSPTIRAFHGTASRRGRQPTATTRRRVTLAWLRSAVPARRCKPTWSLRRAVAKGRAMELPGLALRIRVLWARSIGVILWQITRRFS